jgi:hypothetical protein
LPRKFEVVAATVAAVAGGCAGKQVGVEQAELKQQQELLVE